MVFLIVDKCIVLRIGTLTGCPLCRESHPLCRLKNPMVISLWLLVGFHPASRSVQSSPADNTRKRVWQYIEKERNLFTCWVIFHYFCRLLIFFFKIHFLREKNQEYHLGVKRFVWIKIRLEVVLCLICAQIVCKGYQQTTKFTASLQRVKVVYFPNFSIF